MGHKDSQINILLTSAGRRSYLVDYFREVLKNKGNVYVTNSTPLSIAFERADDAAVSPLIADEGYIPFLLEYAKEKQIDAIIPLFDIDLPALADEKENFEKNGVKVIVSDPEVIDICNDKWKTYLFLKENGFKAPRTFLKLEEILAAIECEDLKYPIIVKPRWGMGSIAIYEAENEEELRVFSRKIERNIAETYLHYLSDDEKLGIILYQEKLNGQEYGLDIINDLSGSYQNTIVKKKLGMRSGETDSAMVVKNEELSAVGKRLSETLRHIGNLDCDIFLVDGTAYVLELNARFGGGYPFSHLAGVNLPEAIVCWLRNEAFNSSMLEPQVGVVGQKEISPVRLLRYQSEVMKIEEACSEAVVLQTIRNLEKDLFITLTERKVVLEDYSRKLYKYGRNFVVKNEQDDVIGILCGYMNDVEEKCAYISLLVVDKTYQRMHLGTKLLKKFEKEAVIAGMKKIKLEMLNGNWNAVKFYKTYGYVGWGEQKEPPFYMTKQLVID